MEAETWADMTPEDVTRMGPQLVRLHVLDNRATKTTWKRQAAGPLKGFKVCVCSALRGSLLASVKCVVYAVRPGACRAFVAGSRQCTEARQEAGLEIENVLNPA